MSDAQAVKYTVVYTTVEDGWVQAQLAELPGVVTVAPSRADVAEYLLNAMQAYLLSLQQPDADMGSGGPDCESVEVAITLKSA